MSEDNLSFKRLENFEEHKSPKVISLHDDEECFVRIEDSIEQENSCKLTILNLIFSNEK